MIKILKEASKEFIMVCHKCDCRFSYELEDLKATASGSYLHCPHCNNVLFHNERQRKVYE